MSLRVGICPARADTAESDQLSGNNDHQPWCVCSPNPALSTELWTQACTCQTAQPHISQAPSQTCHLVPGAQTPAPPPPDFGEEVTQVWGKNLKPRATGPERVLPIAPPTQLLQPMLVSPCRPLRPRDPFIQGGGAEISWKQGPRPSSPHKPGTWVKLTHSLSPKTYQQYHRGKVRHRAVLA